MSEFKLSVQEWETPKPPPRKLPERKPEPEETDALWLYQHAIASSNRAAIRRAVARATLGRSDGSLMDACGGDYNHPALANAIRHWWPKAHFREVVSIVGPWWPSPRLSMESQWLAHALLVEGQPLHALSPADAEALTIVKAHTRGEVGDDEARERIGGLEGLCDVLKLLAESDRDKRWPTFLNAILTDELRWVYTASIFEELVEQVDEIAEESPLSEEWVTLSKWQFFAREMPQPAIAAGLIELYSDPLRIDAREALSRYDGAVAKMRAAMPTVEDIDREIRAEMKKGGAR